MIITCPNCKKKFKIESSLIPEDGRDLKCGSCDHVWLYKEEDVISIPLSLNTNIDDTEVVQNLVKVKNDKVDENNIPLSKNATDNKEEEKNIRKILEKQKTILTGKKKNFGSKLLSYLIVFIISFVALIILLDTLKTSLITIFPGLEIILFNLFELLKDTKLFIIDLY